MCGNRRFSPLPLPQPFNSPPPTPQLRKILIHKMNDKVIFLQTKLLFWLEGFLGRALFNFKWEIFLLRFLGWKTKSIHNRSLLSRVTDWWVGVQGLTVKMLWKLITMMLYLWHACVVTHFGRSVHLLYLPGVLCKLSVQCFKYN